MNDLFSRAMGLHGLRLGDPGVEFGFEHSLPLWGWAILTLAAIAVAWRSYTRLEGARWARFSLGLLRALLLVVLALLIAGPRLLKPNETEEKDWVLVLVDRSASLGIEDVDAAGTGGIGARRISREQQLRSILSASLPAWRSLEAERVVAWLGFDSGAFDLGSHSAKSDALPVALDAPTGRRTDLNRALEIALQRAAARSVSGIVVLSDGQSIHEPSRSVLKRLESEKIPIFSVALGNPAGVSDVGVRRVESPRTAFTNDTVPIEVELERLAPVGASGGASATSGSEGAATIVELVDLSTGDVIASQRAVWTDKVEPDANNGGRESAPREGGTMVSQTQTVRLTSKPKAAGKTRWQIRIRPVDPARPDAMGSDVPSGTQQTDLIEANNTSDFSVQLVDRPMRVLYIDGYPRWEYRYLKNLLVREPSIVSGVLLLSPRRKYLQEGSITLDSLPRSPEEWANFDVVVLGDIWPGVFSSEQLLQLRERVAISGTGLLWIGGEGSTPGAWKSTPLGDLLPFSMQSLRLSGSGGDGAESGSGLDAIDVPVLMSPTPAADRLGVLRLADGNDAGPSWPAALADEHNGWSALQWAQRIDSASLKPTAEVLATARSVGGSAPGLSAAVETPLVVSMRYGAGRVLYVGTDEVWRWRYARGEPFTERFYIQLLRLLGRESLARSNKPALLDVDPARTEIERPVRIGVTLLEQSLVDAGPASLRARIVQISSKGDGSATNTGAATGVDGGEMIELTLLPERTAEAGGGGPPGLERAPARRVFSTTWVPVSAGKYRVEVIDPLLASYAADLTAVAEVWQSDDELRRPQPDHGLLKRLAEASGGRVIPGNELLQVGRWLPNRRVKMSGVPEIATLWDTPAALIAVVLLATLEWLGRRALRLA